MVLVGAGPASEQVLDAVKAKGVEIRFGYGLTETSSGVAISTDENPFAMTPCPDDEITLSGDGEILIKCPECIMKGYYKNKTATDEVLINGVFHTGDLGKFDKDGNLYITGRKKDILVLENGTKIYLAEWEAELQKALNIDDIALAQKDGVVTLFVGDKDGNIDKDDVKNKVNEFNKTKSFDRQIGDVCIMPHALERTATGKIKRWAL
jgi:long-subunit acyl-CoA synthetase (AMP-forming)